MSNSKIIKMLIVATLLVIAGCDRENDPVQVLTHYYNWSVSGDKILLNGEPLEIRGIVYVPYLPGFLPWDLENSANLPLDVKTRIAADMEDISAMGANLVRLWGAPAYCYEVIAGYSNLHVLQTIWIDGEQQDLQEEYFKQSTKNYISTVIDRIYFALDGSDSPVMGYMIGNELSEQSISATDALHPEINQYSGSFISTGTNLTASEAFLAEMADFAKSYAAQEYKDTILVTYGNEIRTYDIIDTPFMDFRSQNAYSYAVDYYLDNPVFGSSTGTAFQGWVEYIKSLYPEMPLLISETGLSVSPNLPPTGPPAYGYGGNTEEEQAQGILSNINDINTAETPLAGVVVHEYLDSWWKFGLEDSYTQDPDDIEEWFGIVKLEKSGPGYKVIFRPAYNDLKELWND